jgi:hypothetical protein
MTPEKGTRDDVDVGSGPLTSVGYFETRSGRVYIIPHMGEDPWKAVERVAKRHGVKTSEVVATVPGIAK